MTPLTVTVSDIAAFSALAVAIWSAAQTYRFNRRQNAFAEPAERLNRLLIDKGSTEPQAQRKAEIERRRKINAAFRHAEQTVSQAGVYEPVVCRPLPPPAAVKSRSPRSDCKATTAPSLNNSALEDVLREVFRLPTAAPSSAIARQPAKAPKTPPKQKGRISATAKEAGTTPPSPPRSDLPACSKVDTTDKPQIVILRHKKRTTLDPVDFDTSAKSKKAKRSANGQQATDKAPANSKKNGRKPQRTLLGKANSRTTPAESRSMPASVNSGTAAVTGPAFPDPQYWICPAVGLPYDVLTNGADLEHAVFASVAKVHNRINETFFDRPPEYAPRFAQKADGGIDPRPWCRGFNAAMNLNLRDWKPLFNRGNINHGLLLPILAYCLDKKGAPVLGKPRAGTRDRQLLRERGLPRHHARRARNQGAARPGTLRHRPLGGSGNVGRSHR